MSAAFDFDFDLPESPVELPHERDARAYIQENAEADSKLVRFRMLFYLPGRESAIGPNFAVSAAATCAFGGA